MQTWGFCGSQALPRFANKVLEGFSNNDRVAGAGSARAF
jgi:hypothetical protein